MIISYLMDIYHAAFAIHNCFYLGGRDMIVLLFVSLIMLMMGFAVYLVSNTPTYSDFNVFFSIVLAAVLITFGILVFMYLFSDEDEGKKK